MLIVFAVIAVPTALACWMTERVDAPRRRAMKMAQPAE